MRESEVGGREVADCTDVSPPWLASRLAVPGSPSREVFYRTVAALGAQAARALHHAHRRNIVHRDIKPENLLISAEDGALRLRVTDFGLSAPEEESCATDGVLMGTPTYMSPEQAIGLNADRRSDIYSLGAVLYELATLTPVVRRGTLQEMIRQIALGKILPPRAIDPALPPPLAEVVMTALARAPEERYDTALELADDLERFSRGEMIRGKRLSLWQRARLLADHHGQVALHAFFIVVALACFALSAFAMHFRKLDAERGAVLRTEAIVRAESERAERELYARRISLGKLAHERGQAGQLSKLLSLTSPRPGEPDRRGWEWYHLRSLDRTGTAVFAQRGTEITAAALNPDGTLLALSRGVPSPDERAWVEEDPCFIEVREGDDATPVLRAQLLLPSPGPALAVAWSADGEMLAAMNLRGEVVAWKVRSWQRVFERAGIGERSDGELSTASLAWSSDGSLLSASRDDRITTWRIPSGEGVLDTRIGETKLLHADATPLEMVGPADGPPVLIYKSAGSMYGVEADSLLDRFRFVLPDGYLVTGLSRDMGVIAYANEEAPAVTVQGIGAFATTVSHFARGSVPISALAFSPDGELLATGDADGLVTIRETSTGQERSRHFGRGLIMRLEWSLDGEKLLAVGLGGTAKVWELERTHAALTIRATIANWLRGPDGDVLLAFSPDGLQVAAIESGSFGRGHDAYRLTSWDAASGTPIVSLPWDPNRHARSVRWQGDRPVLAPWPGSPAVLRDPEGKLTASPSARIQGAVDISEAGTGKVLRSLAGSGEHRPTGWSPRGRHLVTHDERAMRIWDIRSGDIKLELTESKLREHRVTWSEDDSTVAVRAFTSAEPPRLIDVSGGKEIAKLRDEEIPFFYSVAFQPGGDRIAVGGGVDGMVGVFDARTGALLLTLETGGEGSVDLIAWSPDGKKLAAFDDRGRRLVIWDATAGYRAGDLADAE